MRSTYSRYSFKIAAAIALGLLLRVGLSAATREDRAALNELRRQMSESRLKLAAEGGPKFLLPPEERRGWIAAWNKLRECALAHGFDGVMPVADSYGDGMTPSPAISASGLARDRALTECQFDTSLFDEAKVSAAVDAQLQRDAPMPDRVP